MRGASRNNTPASMCETTRIQTKYILYMCNSEYPIDVGCAQHGAVCVYTFNLGKRVTYVYIVKFIHIHICIIYIINLYTLSWYRQMNPNREYANLNSYYMRCFM